MRKLRNLRALKRVVASALYELCSGSRATAHQAAAWPRVKPVHHCNGMSVRLNGHCGISRYGEETSFPSTKRNMTRPCSFWYIPDEMLDSLWAILRPHYMSLADN